MTKKILIAALVMGIFSSKLLAQNPFRAVTINEVMADPNPVIGLPEVEYVEIFNSTDETIELEGWFLVGATPNGQSFASFLLVPGGFLILTDDGNVGAFPDVDVIPWGTSGALTNSGETLILQDNLGNTIDSLIYSSSSGGRSFEQIDPTLEVFTPANYMLSESPNGGTPGFQNSVFEIDTDAPDLVSVLVNSQSQLELLFSEPIDESSGINSANYIVNNGFGNPDEVLIQEENTVLLNFDNVFQDQIENILTVNSIQDLSGNVLNQQEIAFTYFEPFAPNFRDIVINEIMADPSGERSLPAIEYMELFNASNRSIDLAGWRIEGVTPSDSELESFILNPSSYVVLVESGSESLFDLDNVISWGGLGALTNSGETLTLVSPNGIRVDSVVYTNAQDGISFEQANPFLLCSDFEFNFSLSESEFGGTPGAENSLFNTIPDANEPELEQLLLETPSQLLLEFNEPMDINSILDEDNYVTTLSVIDIELINIRTIRIRFVSELSREELSTITIERVSDCSGNEITSEDFIFGLPSSPSFLDLLITEIMADPGLSDSDLPDAEYLEIVNKSSSIISLENVALADAISSAELPNINLLPMERIILSSTSNIEAFSLFGNVIGVSGFPSLNNSGDQISLAFEDEIIHSVSYNINWYDDLIRSQGGFSLEMIDENNPCGEDANWTSSLNDNGGTPGMENAVNEPNPDSMSPKLLGVVPTSFSSIELRFNEIIDPQISVDLIELSDNLVIDSIVPSNTLSNRLNIGISPELEESRTYELTINDVEDCVGNLSNRTEAFEFFIPEQSDTSDVLLSEVLFNPRDGGVDYVEIFNNSNKRFNINSWMLADTLGEDEQLITDRNIIFEPFQYLLLTESINSTINQYPRGNRERFIEVSQLPSLPNMEGSVSIIDSSGTEIDFFRYDEDFHSEIINNVDGVALERISFESETNTSSNWTSSVESEFFGTPGKRNAQSFEPTSSGNTIELLINDDQSRKQSVFDPFNGEEIKINYNFSTPGNVVTVSIYDSNGRRIRDLVQNQSVGTNGFFEPWDGTNNEGSLARIGYYVILTEIFNTNGEVTSIKSPVVVATRF
ncbi:MAG: lamin tail domain-containing protein [Bacteroidota bacterium]